MFKSVQHWHSQALLETAVSVHFFSRSCITIYFFIKLFITFSITWDNNYITSGDIAGIRCTTTFITTTPCTAAVSLPLKSIYLGFLCHCAVSGENKGDNQ